MKHAVLAGVVLVLGLVTALLMRSPQAAPRATTSVETVTETPSPCDGIQLDPKMRTGSRLRGRGSLRTGPPVMSSLPQGSRSSAFTCTGASMTARASSWVTITHPLKTLRLERSRRCRCTSRLGRPRLCRRRNEGLIPPACSSLGAGTIARLARRLVRPQPERGPGRISIRKFKPPTQIYGSVPLLTARRSRGWGVVPIAQSVRIHVTR